MNKLLIYIFQSRNSNNEKLNIINQKTLKIDNVIKLFHERIKTEYISCHLTGVIKRMIVIFLSWNII